MIAHHTHHRNNNDDTIYHTRRKYALATAVVVVVLYGYLFVGKRGSLADSGYSYGVAPNYDSMRATLRHQDEKIAMLEE